MKTLLSRNPYAAIAAFGIFAAALFAAYAALSSSPFDIEFPIPELENCADKTACKAYCDDAEHQDACRAFAEKHGLGASKQEADETVQKLEQDGGPGDCAKGEKNPARACKRYCDDVAHIEECVAYAKEHDLMEGHELEEAEKVLSALKRGVKLPPQCQDARSCKEVCEDPADIKTARACFEFGKEAGLLPPDVSVEQAEKAFSALEKGEGPFKSFAEMRQCDNPPTDDLMQKCIEFAEKAGFMSQEEAEIVKKTGGKGPGGCRGREQCEAYCQEHGEECFAFAEEHGLIREEDKARMREGINHMREAMERAPEEVAACIRNGVPELEAILAGEKPASPKIGDTMRRCFENHFRNQQNFGEGGPEKFRGGPMEGPGGMPQFPPEVAKCLEKKFGAGFMGEFKKERPSSAGAAGSEPSQELEEKIRGCFEAMRSGASGQDKKIPPFEGTDAMPPQGGDDFKERFNREFQEQFQQQHQQEFNSQYQEQYREQMRQFMPGQMPPPAGMIPPPGMMMPPPDGMMPPSGSYLPPEGGTQPPPPPPESTNNSGSAVNGVFAIFGQFLESLLR